MYSNALYRVRKPIECPISFVFLSGDSDNKFGNVFDIKT